MNKFKIFALVFLTIALFASCEKEEADTTKPTITVNAPGDEEVLYTGVDVHFDVDFADDVELKSYKVDIHSNFDGHEHKNPTADSIAWTFQKSWSFDAGLKNSHVHHHEIVIPTEVDGVKLATGDYHFMIYCTDAAGNESYVAIPVEIHEPTDSIEPTVNSVSAPASNQVFTNSQTISISGTVSDDNHLEGLFVAIMAEGSTISQVNATECFAVMMHEHDAVHEQTSYDFSASINVGQAQDNNTTPKPILWTPGNYYLIVKVMDESGNYGYSTQYPIVIQ